MRTLTTKAVAAKRAALRAATDRLRAAALTLWQAMSGADPSSGRSAQHAVHGVGGTAPAQPAAIP